MTYVDGVNIRHYLYIYIYTIDEMKNLCIEKNVVSDRTLSCHSQIDDSIKCPALEKKKHRHVLLGTRYPV